MAKYKVYYERYNGIAIDVEADSEEEALEKADKEVGNKARTDWTLGDIEFDDIEVEDA